MQLGKKTPKRQKKTGDFGTWSETESQMLVCKLYILNLFLRKFCRPEKRDDFVPKILFQRRGSVLHPHRPAAVLHLEYQNHDPNLQGLPLPKKNRAKVKVKEGVEQIKL